MEKRVIKPTLGRVVHYKSDLPPHEEHAALIAKVHSDNCINLAVFDDNGVPYSRQNVLLVQEDEPAPEHGYAHWMQYQLAVAGGQIPPVLHVTEESEKHPVGAQGQGKPETPAPGAPVGGIGAGPESTDKATDSGGQEAATERAA